MRAPSCRLHLGFAIFGLSKRDEQVIQPANEGGRVLKLTTIAKNGLIVQ